MPRVARVPVGRVEEERKKLILDAAAECTVEDGVDSLTLRKIAKRAGVSIGMISYYFPTKNDLLIATLQKTADRITEETTAEFGIYPHNSRRLRKALEVGLAPGEEGGNWAFRLGYFARAAHEPELASFYAKRLQLVKSAMAEGLQGEISDKLDIDLCADLLLCLNQGLGVETTIDSQHLTLERALAIWDFAVFLMTQYKPAFRVLETDPSALVAD